jgi:hypothetical protein
MTPRAIGILVAVPVVAALVLTLFAWPSARLEPRGLPVGVVGPAHLPAGSGLDEHRYASEADAREAIEDREIYGAIGSGKVLTASAASPMVAQLLTHAAPKGASVEDVVPAGRSGSALGASVLPIMLAGLFTGVLCAFVGGGALRKAALLVEASVIGGLAGAAIVDSWLGVVGGDWLANAGALGLTLLAVAATVTGLHAVLGERGIGLAVLTMVLVGNPFSGVGSAPELLPRPVGGLGQLLPPGAGGNLLRSTGFFDGAAAAGHATVLAVWALAGMGLLALAALRERRPQMSGALAPA